MGKSAHYISSGVILHLHKPLEARNLMFFENSKDMYYY